MDATDRIEPALSAEEWRDGGEDIVILNEAVDAVVELPKLIALANAALPDSDPRKITREWIAAIRDAEPIGTESYRGYDEKADAMLKQIADALESYLPHE